MFEVRMLHILIENARACCTYLSRLRRRIFKRKLSRQRDTKVKCASNIGVHIDRPAAAPQARVGFDSIGDKSFRIMDRSRQ